MHFSHFSIYFRVGGGRTDINKILDLKCCKDKYLKTNFSRKAKKCFLYFSFTSEGKNKYPKD